MGTCGRGESSRLGSRLRALADAAGMSRRARILRFVSAIELCPLAIQSKYKYIFDKSSSLFVYKHVALYRAARWMK